MVIWQGDLVKLPGASEQTKQWLLLICDRQKNIVYQAQSPQAEVNGSWLTEQLKKATQTVTPDKLQIFRPQITGLFSIATEALEISLETTRRTPQLKAIMSSYFQNGVSSAQSKLGLEKPVPQNLPEAIWGENWNFVSIDAGEIIDFSEDRPLPFRDVPLSLVNQNSELEPQVKVPGIVIYGGRKSLILAQWLVKQRPAALNSIATEIGKSGGLVLETGLVDRWIIATFESESVAQAAKAYEQNKKFSQGLHFLLLQPDDSGMTHTGFWLLKDE